MGEPFNAAGGASGPRASIGVRFVAALIDGIILGIAVRILQAVLGFPAGTAVGVLLGIAYFAYFEGQPAGQTLGKRAMNIRVIDFATGGSLDSSKALVRSLVREVSGLACAIGFIWALFNPEKQTWHDLAANTVVVPTSAYPPPA
ncbi:MAG TPA: RDD family protein [Acidimicrobiales bacterium]|nr:RDD family protein [Acidimicrobiales bacterium]